MRAKSKKANTQRAMAGYNALKAYPRGDQNDPQSSIVDLVSDLLHLAEYNKLDAEQILDMAREHWEVESGRKEEGWRDL